MNWRFWQRRRCYCGYLRVGRHTRTELRGVSHGETTCFTCDTYGRPLHPEAVKGLW
jgi:hypothetical protein